MSAVIERALSTVQSYENVEEWRVKQTLHRLNEKKQRLLGVEEDARKDLEYRIVHLMRDLKQMTESTRHGYGKLDLAVLDWRKGVKDGIPMPTLALTSLLNPVTSFIASGKWTISGRRRKWLSSGGTSFMPTLPEPLLPHYADVSEAIYKMSNRKNCLVEVSSRYTGVIPDEAREAIINSPFREECIFLLREVDEWTVRTRRQPKPARPPMHLDPIVVGYAEMALWVITRFDPTPVEEYISDEFALMSGGMLELPAGPPTS